MTRKTLRTDEQAVSPVIGVILMVAITVILAAVIGTMVMGIGQDSVSQQATASVSVSGNTTTLDSLAPGADGIKCSDHSGPLYQEDDGGEESRAGTWTAGIGDSIDCSGSNSVVAFSNSTDVQNSTVYTFDN